MKRRQFLKGAIAGGVTVGLLGGGTFWLSNGPNKASLSMQVVLTKINFLLNTPLLSSGQWRPAQIFTHCAQSVEYSMAEYPEHKTELFKRTIGQLAFSAFSEKGAMHHGLSEAIPGAPDASLEKDPKLALQRLAKAFIDFSQYQGILASHFAYGELSKQDYELAHVMHFYNHLQEIKL